MKIVFKNKRKVGQKERLVKYAARTLLNKNIPVSIFENTDPFEILKGLSKNYGIKARAVAIVRNKKLIGFTIKKAS